MPLTLESKLIPREIAGVYGPLNALIEVSVYPISSRKLGGISLEAGAGQGRVLALLPLVASHMFQNARDQLTEVVKALGCCDAKRLYRWKRSFPVRSRL